MTRAISSSNWRADRAAAITASSSTSALDFRQRSQSTPELTFSSPLVPKTPVAPITMVPSGANTALQTVSIKDENIHPMIRELSTGRLINNYLHLSFLHGSTFHPTTSTTWFSTVLPSLASMTFILSSTSDVHFMLGMFPAPHLYAIHTAITSLSFPQFYWFGGITPTHTLNPYFQLCALLPNLESLTLTLHNAGITDSCWGEREMCRLERSEPEKARWRKVWGLEKIVGKYALEAVLGFRSLRRVRVETVICERTKWHTKGGDAEVAFAEVREWLVEGFARQGREIVVEMEEVKRE